MTNHPEYRPFNDHGDVYRVGLAAHLEAAAKDWFSAEGAPVTIGRQELNAFLHDVRSLAGHVQAVDSWREHDEAEAAKLAQDLADLAVNYGEATGHLNYARHQRAEAWAEGYKAHMRFDAEGALDPMHQRSWLDGLKRNPYRTEEA